MYVTILCLFVIWACFLAWRDTNARLLTAEGELAKARKSNFDEAQFRSQQELYYQLTNEQRLLLKPIAESGHSVGKLTPVQHTLAQGIIDKTSWLTRDLADPVYSFRDQETREIVRRLIRQDEPPTKLLPLLKGQLEITQAKYGAQDNWKDVTSILRSMISDGRLMLLDKKYNDLFPPDHIKGVPKKLIVDYLYNGREFSVTNSEDSDLILPPLTGDAR